MHTIKIVAALAALTLAASGCSDLDDAVERARTTETVTATQTTEAAPVTVTATTQVLPDDRVVESATVDTGAGAEEAGFRAATCELLDEGYSLEMLMATNAQLDFGWTPERSGELMAEAIMQECPQHLEEMIDVLSDLGY